MAFVGPDPDPGHYCEFCRAGNGIYLLDGRLCCLARLVLDAGDRAARRTALQRIASQIGPRDTALVERLALWHWQRRADPIATDERLR